MRDLVSSAIYSVTPSNYTTNFYLIRDHHVSGKHYNFLDDLRNDLSHLLSAGRILSQRHNKLAQALAE